jgi:hypothetical protein
MAKTLIAVAFLSALGTITVAQTGSPITVSADVRRSEICRGDEAGDFQHFAVRLSFHSGSSTPVLITTPILVETVVTATSDENGKPILSMTPETFGAVPKHVRAMMLNPNQVREFDVTAFMPIGKTTTDSMLGPGHYCMHLVLAPWVPLIQNNKSGVVRWAEKVNSTSFRFEVPSSWTARRCK